MKRFIKILISLFTLFAVVGCSAMLKDIGSLTKGTPYTVNYHFEAIDSDAYDEELTESEVFRGTAGEETAVTAKEFLGFTVIPTPIEQKTITEDGLAVVDVYYKRNQVSITFDPDTGKWSDDNTTASKSYNGKFGAPFDSSVLPLVLLDDYTFVKWTPEIPNTFPAVDVVITALWSQSAAPYTIEHYFEKAIADKTEYESKAEYPAETDKGEIGADTDARAKTVTGFTAKDVKQEKIDQNGSTVVKIYYDRNIVNVSFDGGAGSSWTGLKTFQGKYGTPLADPRSTLEKADYELVGWDPEFDGFFPATDKAYTAKWNKTGALYTIKYYKEAVDSPSMEEFKTDQARGEVGKETAVTAEKITGFMDPVITQATVNAEGTSVVTVEYSRKVINLTLNPDGGLGGKWKTSGSSAVKVISGKYGATITGVPEALKEDYAFVRWGDSGLPQTFPAEDATYNAYYSKSVAEYTVHHKFENINDSGYTEDAAKKQTLKGAIDQLTTATSLDLEGFIPQLITQKYVVDDGSTEVDVFYKREKYTLTFDGNGGSWTAAKTVTGKYGAAVVAPDTADLTKEDYKFSKWSPDVPATFTADGNFTAVWTKVNALYKVEYYFEAADSDDYVIDTSKTTTSNKGKIGATTSVTAANVEHFKAPVITQATILEDDSAVVKVKYPRETVTYTYKLDGGTVNGSTSDIVVTGKYDGTVVKPDFSTLAKTNFIFKEWSPAIPAKYSSNMTFTAKWGVSLSGATVNLSGTSDITVTTTNSDKAYTFTVATPYVGNWTYKWIIDGVYSAKNTASITETLTSGNHTIIVIATENGKNTHSKTVSVNVN